MIEWWESNLNAISKQKFSKIDFTNMVVESRLLFRHGIKELLEEVNEHGIPMFIVSAGISEVIEAHFCAILENGDANSQAAKESWETLGIYSNSFIYEDGTIQDF